MSIQTLSSITKTRLLLGEGVEDVMFFEGLLRHLGRDDIQVCEFKGKTKLEPFLKALPTFSGFSEVISIGVTRDADYLPRAKSQKTMAAEAAFDGIKSALKKAGLPCPKKHASPVTGDFDGRQVQTSIFVFPDGRDSGMLEDLCLKSIKDDPAINCLDEFFDCVSNRVGRSPAVKDVAKARIHAWLATQPNPELRLGQAALQDPPIWDFDDSAIEPFKCFLREL